MDILVTTFMVMVLIALIILLVKFLLCNCLFIRNDDDSTPILPGRREAFWIEYDRLRMQAMWARQAPPDFDEALRTSRPVSHLDVEEEPPPTYDDFLKSQDPSPASLSPLEEGVNFTTEATEAEGAVSYLNPFENDFVVNLEHNVQEPEQDLGEAVFGVGRSRSRSNSDYQSEA